MLINSYLIEKFIIKSLKTKFKRIIVISLFFLLYGCTGYTIASLTSNIVTYSVTGKTNSDHVISYVTEKDCKLFRIVDKNKNICETNQRNIIIATNEKETNINKNYFEDEKEIIIAKLNDEEILNNQQKKISYEITNKENKPMYKKIANNIYYGSITWAEYQITRGTKITDSIGLTENLTLEVENTFKNYFY